MKKKVIISVAAIAVLVAVTAVLIALNRSESNPKDGSAQNRSLVRLAEMFLTALAVCFTR